MTSAVALHTKHSEAVAAWEAQLVEADSYIAELQEALNEARMDALRRDPLKRPGGVGTEVGDLTRKLDAELKKRDGLARDLAASKLILEELQQDATEEARERELREAQQAVADAEAEVAQLWADEFTPLARKLVDAWGRLCPAIQKLDGLPAGESPLTVDELVTDTDARTTDRDGNPIGARPQPRRITRTLPLPGDLMKGIELALKDEADSNPFASLPRVVARRLSVVRTAGLGVQDVTGYTRDLRSMGDFR